MTSEVYIGFDCANKSLATSHVVFGDVNAVTDRVRDVIFEWLRLQYATPAEVASLAANTPAWTAVISRCDVSESLKLIRSISNVVADVIRLVRCEVIDLIPGRKVKDVTVEQRTKLLRGVLCGLGYDVTPETTVVVENQPDFNFKSSTVRDQLLMFYADCRLVIVSPSEKNKIVVDEGLTLESFTSRYKKRYDAVKNHTRANFLRLVEIWGWGSITAHIPKPYLDDAADSFMQVLACWRKKYG